MADDRRKSNDVSAEIKDLEEIIAQGEALLEEHVEQVPGLTAEVSGWAVEFNKRAIRSIIEDSKQRLEELKRNS